MEGDTPDFNVFHFSFLDDTLPNWEKEIELSDTELLSCAEAQVKEAIETTTRFPKLSGDDIHATSVKLKCSCFRINEHVFAV